MKISDKSPFKAYLEAILPAIATPLLQWKKIVAPILTPDIFTPQTGPSVAGLS
ncbi:MAG: hypothetical protein J7641_00115 [Cyanobacteria bacterium SID2]|nr:hypothetical protein [Cyanobacteria bacterium SID2]MBP0005314.1 hypothetical protein [Cyanobacteria bacterium SBC]